jgi:LCP family protein required for cell wall assembly
MNVDPPKRRKRPANIDGFINTSKHSVVSKLAAKTVPKPVAKPLVVKKPVSAKEGRSPLKDDPSLDEETLNELRQFEAQPENSMLNRNLTPQKTSKRFNFIRKKRSKKKLALIAIVSIFILGIAGGAWDAYQLYHKVHHIQVGNLTASVGGAENILIAGSTNRCNLKVQNSQWGFCSDGVTGVNSDVIFIVHVVPKTDTISVLSIPRDTFVPNARSGNQAFKIDAALYEGPTQLVQAVEEDFGIPIQHYVEVGFDGFVNIVNAIGGIKMDFPEAVYDSESYLNVKAPGCYLLNGVQGLQVIRARHLQYKAPGITTSDVNDWPQETESS